jgi:hypothetical protein
MADEKIWSESGLKSGVSGTAPMLVQNSILSVLYFFIPYYTI